MTRIVRLVSLVPPLISIWGVKSKLTASRQPCNHTLTPYATLGAMLTFLHFFKKALRLKRNSLKTKPKRFSSNSFKNKPLSRTTVCEGNSTVENGLPTASCLKTNGNKSLSFTHRRLQILKIYFRTIINYPYKKTQLKRAVFFI